jgi:hypothetical protein
VDEEKYKRIVGHAEGVRRGGMKNLDSSGVPQTFVG